MAMNISKAAKETGLPVRTIRYYEDIGLVTPDRLESGYRAFSSGDIEALRFLKASRDLGFSLEDCRLLLALWSDQARSAADVKALARKRLQDLDEQIAALQKRRDRLASLTRACHGDSSPDCAILDGLQALGAGKPSEQG